MSIHIGANKGDIADKILLPGDPLRAKFIAENYFENVKQYNEVRGMLGYTGTYKGERISVHGTRIGVPSISIYVNELMYDYDVQKIIRVSTCGSMQEEVSIRDIIIAQGSTTDSQMKRNTFGGVDYARLADFDLLKNAHNITEEKRLTTLVGNVFTSD